MRVIINKTAILNVLFLRIVAFLILPVISFASTQNDTISVDVNWLPIKNINVIENEYFKTLNADNALFLEEYHFLPVIPLKIRDKEIIDVKILSVTSDSLSANEKSIFEEKYLPSFPNINYRSLLIRDRFESEILFFPFYYDTVSQQFLKINAVRLIINTKEKNIQNSSRSSLRTSSSVLANGRWFKIAVLENGVYKLDKNNLSKLGVDVESIDPEKIKIFGNGGGMLPQENSAPRIEDLYENSIYVKGENDGSFDNDDYVLFYGQSPHKIDFDPEDQAFDYKHNIYSDTTFYFLNIDGSDGKRISSLENLGSNHPKINTYDDILYYEDNSNSIISSGREWYGEKFDARVYQSFAFDAGNIVPESEITFYVKVIGQTYEPTIMEVGVNDDYFGEFPIGTIPEGTYLTKGVEEDELFTYSLKNINTGSLNINLKFNQISGVRSSALLDYINLKVKKHLIAENKQIVWRSYSSIENPRSTFELSYESIQGNVWDVTNPLEPANQAFDITGNKIVFGADTDELKEFIWFSENNLKSPVLIGEIENQNIRGESVPDLIIVSHPLFLPEAKRLADHRRSFDNLDVLVLTPELIYNEFSSGSQDVTAIRDMVRYFYIKGNEEKIKNLLIFGRGSYDYKDRVRNNTNFVPIYQSRNSFHPVFSYGSDDYYAFMDGNEGHWGENYQGDHTMDIGVGRLPVRTREEAKVVVDKLINYSSNPKTLGEWRSQIYLVADDGDGNIFQEDAEELANYIDTSAAKFNTKKIYLDAYEQITEPSIEYSPEANEAIEKAIEKGALIMNFIGHGSETRWCQETILDINMIREWENLNKLPLFVTATCEFGKHDDPKTTSGADFLLFNENGGAIGLVTTSRPVYSNTNFDINKAFYNNLFERDENGYLDLGTIFKNTKNNSLKGANNRNFILLGDPSMKLAFPRSDVKLSVESEDYKNPGDTISGLEKIKMKGAVVDSDQNTLTGFNGIVTATLYDQPTVISTFGNQSASMDFEVRNSIIFKGDATVKNGNFEFEFITPKDLLEITDHGKLSFYAREDNTLADAGGAEIDISIGGPLENEIMDNTSPEITLFINDSTFESNGITSPDILALAKIFDENGITILNNDKIQGVLISVDGAPFEYVGDYFKNEKDNYKKGWLSYPVFDLEEGEHTLSVGAYDTNGNYAEEEIEFTVTSGDKFVIRNLYNYPNPFIDHTTFSFEHNKAGEDLVAELQIFNIKGKLIYRHTQKIVNSTVKVEDIKWYGQSFSGNRLEPGVYMYVLNLRSSKDQSNISAKNKLLIIK